MRELSAHGALGLLVMCVVFVLGLGGCEEAEAPREVEPPPPLLVEDARALAAVLEADTTDAETSAVDVALLEDRGVRAGVLIRTRIIPVIIARLAAIEAMELQTDEGRQMRGVARIAYETRKEGLEQQAALLEAVDGEGLEYLDAVQLERRGVQNLAQLAGAIQAILQAHAAEPQH